MKTDIILCGVGGQGILSIATVIGEAATACGLNLKQAEVHGMSQRGGAVQSDLRLSTETIWSDLIPGPESGGGADLIISMEPLEALRYLPRLSEKGSVITATAPFVNIPDYPSGEWLSSKYGTVRNAVQIDIDMIAASCGSARSANMVLLGAASKYLEIIGSDALREAISRIFATKGETVVKANLVAFDLGLSHSSEQ